MSAPRLVDRDNFQDVLARLGVELDLGAIGGDAESVAVQFACLDDFHPDRIYERVSVFQQLGRIRLALQNPNTFTEAAAEVRSWAQTKLTPTPSIEPKPSTQRTTDATPANVENLFDRVLDQTGDRSHDVKSPSDVANWNALIQSVTESYAVPGADPQQPELVACVDAASTALMRAILHHPHFQAIEASWRSLYFLVRRVETDTELKVYMLDISKNELAADLTSRELTSTGIYKLLVEQSVGTPGADPWSLFIANFSFDRTREDAELLASMGTLAQHAGAPFVAGAAARLLGCISLAETPDPDDWRLAADAETLEAWTNLRRLPDAEYIGLAVPRCLLRLPYGPKTDPIERFDFEELASPADHERYLWGNPSLACACLLAQAFRHYGWSFRPGMVREIDGLPVHVYTADGEHQVKPCAEVVLTERAIDRVASLGFMPLISYQGQDIIRLASFRSIADPERPLAGRWSS